MKVISVINDKNRFIENISLMYPSVNFFRVLEENSKDPLKYNDEEDYKDTSPSWSTVVCYDNSLCQLYPSTLADKNGTVCRDITEFTWLPFDSKEWPVLYSMIERTFYACALPINFNRSSFLFHCPNTHTYLSKHRVRDGISDCLFDSDELEPLENVCTVLNNHFQCLLKDDCVQRKNLFGNREGTCKDGSDIMLPLRCSSVDDLGCRYLRNESSIQINDIFLFQEICNGVVHPHLEGDDEMNCDEWKIFCNYKYVSECDGISQCTDGRDEYARELRCAFSAEKDISCLNPNNISRNQYFLPKEKINDGNTDCLGGVDEEAKHCRSKYPTDLTRRYRCWNSSECIRIDQLCDGFENCPLY
ncbi:unnamed protein product, partial [Didymodactylos carnosus]